MTVKAHELLLIPRRFIFAGKKHVQSIEALLAIDAWAGDNWPPADPEDYEKEILAGDALCEDEHLMSWTNRKA